MKLLTTAHLAKLIANGKAQRDVKGTLRENDFEPVVKLFHAAGGATWLLTEVELDDHDIAWGLCDLGMGCPEFGTVRISELEAFKGRFGLGIERDLHWTARGPISAYVAAAHEAGRIVQLSADDTKVQGREREEGPPG